MNKLPVCNGFMLCEVCRRQDESGSRFRRSVVRFVPNMVVDFECPYKLPWLDKELTHIDLELFRAAVSKIRVNKFNEVVSERINRVNIAANDLAFFNVFFNHLDKVKSVLPPDHKLIFAIDEYFNVLKLQHGCPSCRISRSKNKIYNEYNKCTEEEKSKIKDALNFVL